MALTIRPDSAVFRGASPEVTAAIKEASAESGVSFSYLMTKAATESGFRADVKAKTSSATGLFQFIERTWLNMVREHGDKAGLERYSAALESGRVDGKLRREILDLRKDPKAAAMMAAQYAAENKEHLEKRVGCEVGATELYLAHFLGPGGAEKFLKAYHADASRAAASVCPEAAGANRSIFYDGDGKARSLRQVYDRFAAKFESCDTDELASTSMRSTPQRPVEPAATAAAAPTGGVPSVVPKNVLSPAAYAARMFMAGLSMPGERSGIR